MENKREILNNLSTALYTTTATSNFDFQYITIQILVCYKKKLLYNFEFSAQVAWFLFFSNQHFMEKA